MSAGVIAASYVEDSEIVWNTFDLSTADFFEVGGFIAGEYSAGELIPHPGGGSPVFCFPGFTLDLTKNYQFELTTIPDAYFGIMAVSAANVYTPNDELYYQFGLTSPYLADVGPGIDEWNDMLTSGRTVIRFDAARVTQLRWREVT